jgi:hypothetical protein
MDYPELLFPPNTGEISKELAVFVAKGWGECPFWVFRSSKMSLYGLHWVLNLLGQFPTREAADTYAGAYRNKQESFSGVTDKTVSAAFNEDGTQKK